MIRRNTKTVNVGNLKIGGEAPITIQSMLNTKNGDVKGAIKQTIALK